MICQRCSQETPVRRGGNKYCLICSELVNAERATAYRITHCKVCGCLLTDETRSTRRSRCLECATLPRRQPKRHKTYVNRTRGNRKAWKLPWYLQPDETRQTDIAPIVGWWTDSYEEDQG